MLFARTSEKHATYKEIRKKSNRNIKTMDHKRHKKKSKVKDRPYKDMMRTRNIQLLQIKENLKYFNKIVNLIRNYLKKEIHNILLFKKSNKTNTPCSLF